MVGGGGRGGQALLCMLCAAVQGAPARAAAQCCRRCCDWCRGGGCCMGSPMALQCTPHHHSSEQARQIRAPVRDSRPWDCADCCNERRCARGFLSPVL